MSLKLYVWEGVLSDYTDGIALTLANNEDEAREQVLAEYTKDWCGCFGPFRKKILECFERELAAKPDVFNPEDPNCKVAIVLPGGG